MRDDLRLQERLEELEKKVEFYEYIFDNVKAIMHITTPEGIQRWCNKACQEFTGFTAEEMTEYGGYRYVKERAHPEDIAFYTESTKHLSNPNFDNYVGVYRQKNKDGNFRKFVGVSKIVKRLKDSTPEEAICCSIDVTDKFDSDNQVELILKENLLLKNELKIKEISKREKQILRLISQGMTSLDISIELQISRHTVKTHRKNIMRKLSINNINDLVRFAVECGMC